MESERSPWQAAGMEAFRTRLLDVKIAAEPPLWRWQVLAGDFELSTGFEKTKIQASFAGYNKMFRLLAEGWSPSPSKSP